jgi:hypothetical protein
MFFVWSFLDKTSPTFIQTRISLVIGDLLPFHAEIGIKGNKEGV